jgi:hypothetical protein
MRRVRVSTNAPLPPLKAWLPFQKDDRVSKLRAKIALELGKNVKAADLRLEVQGDLTSSFLFAIASALAECFE